MNPKSEGWPQYVLNAKRPHLAAARLVEFLQASVPEAKDAKIRAPEASAKLGWGRFWSVAWSSGAPFEWAVSLSIGSTLYAGETGNYSDPGPFAKGMQNERWHVECQNGNALVFIPR